MGHPPPDERLEALEVGKDGKDGKDDKGYRDWEREIFILSCHREAGSTTLIDLTECRHSEYYALEAPYRFGGRPRGRPQGRPLFFLA
jgi:hypothetical protein